MMRPPSIVQNAVVSVLVDEQLENGAHLRVTHDPASARPFRVWWHVSGYSHSVRLASQVAALSFVDGIRAEAKASEYSLRAKLKLRRTIWTRYDGRCVYCGRWLSLGAFTLEHLIPRSLGGSDHACNLAVACEPCNTERDTKPLLPWLLRDDQHLSLRDRIFRQYAFSMAFHGLMEPVRAPFHRNGRARQGEAI